MVRASMYVNDMKKQPSVFVFAGPNGSGKSTIANKMERFGTYVNADDIKKAYGLSDLEAAKKAESLRNMLLNQGRDFSFETVLSTERNLLLLQRTKAQGYEIQCIYVLTSDVNINVGRVKARYIFGGHDVPEEKIRSRYVRALALLPKLLNVCDTLLIYDNTDVPVPIFIKNGKVIKIEPNKYWTKSHIVKLLNL